MKKSKVTPNNFWLTKTRIAWSSSRMAKFSEKRFWNKKKMIQNDLGCLRTGRQGHLGRQIFKSWAIWFANNRILAKAFLKCSFLRILFRRITCIMSRFLKISPLKNCHRLCRLYYQPFLLLGLAHSSIAKSTARLAGKLGNVKIFGLLSTSPSSNSLFLTSLFHTSPHHSLRRTSTYNSWHTSQATSRRTSLARSWGRQDCGGHGKRT